MAHRFTSEEARAASAKASPRGPTKIPQELRGGVLESYRNRGGVKWLDSLPDELFVPIFRGVLPKEVTGADGGPVTIQVVTGVPKADESA